MSSRCWCRQSSSSKGLTLDVLAILRSRAWGAPCRTNRVHLLPAMYIVVVHRTTCILYSEQGVSTHWKRTQYVLKYGLCSGGEIHLVSSEMGTTFVTIFKHKDISCD